MTNFFKWFQVKPEQPTDNEIIKARLLLNSIHVKHKKVQISSLYGYPTPETRRKLSWDDHLIPLHLRNHFEIVQWGTDASIVRHLENPSEFLIMDNDYLMMLDELGKVVTT